MSCAHLKATWRLMDFIYSFFFKRLTSLQHFLWKAIQWSGWRIADGKIVLMAISLWEHYTPHVSPSLTRKQFKSAIVWTSGFFSCWTNSCIQTGTTIKHFRWLLIFIFKTSRYFLYPYLSSFSYVSRRQFHVNQNIFWFFVNCPGVCLAEPINW